MHLDRAEDQRRLEGGDRVSERDEQRRKHAADMARFEWRAVAETAIGHQVSDEQFDSWGAEAARVAGLKPEEFAREMADGRRETEWREDVQRGIS